MILALSVALPHERRRVRHATFARFLELLGGGALIVPRSIAPAMLVTVYHLLARQTTYQDPGADYDDRRHAERGRRRAIHELERQDYRVVLEPAA